MKKIYVLLAVLSLSAASIFAEDKPKKHEADENKPETIGFFKPEEKTTEGSVTINGKRVDYEAVAGTSVVHPKDWNDVPPAKDSEAADDEEKDPEPEASMFYVAYFKKGADPEKRPITFLYNGGPGSSTVWLHMGAFGPRRVVTAENTHTPAAPYQVVDNDSSLLDASDLVFIDAPGTGFSRVAGKDAEKAFYGVDQDAYAFSRFILQFLSKYGRWNSPKYLFGESYGTTRSAVLVDELETQDSVDFNGVILLSQALCYDLSPDEYETNPAVDLPYVVVLPTYAATAWYHHKLPNYKGDLEPFLKEVENFAMTDYTQALAAGLSLDAKTKDDVAEKLHEYTGLPVDYIKKADLRVDYSEFQKVLKDDNGMVVGQLDTRFSGPPLDPLSEGAGNYGATSGYDPQSAAIGSAYVSAFNQYARGTLHYGEGQDYKLDSESVIYGQWDYKHTSPALPGEDSESLQQAINVMPDLADAMKQNPNLKVFLNGGYYDLATPYYEGIYEMRHLPIPQKLFANISSHYYQSGHMVYVYAPALKNLHDSVAEFIRSTDNSAP